MESAETNLVTEQELTKRARIRAQDAARPLHKRRFAGAFGDYLIIDENGREVWASEWCRKAYIATRPRGVMRYR